MHMAKAATHYKLKLTLQEIDALYLVLGNYISDQDINHPTLRSIERIFKKIESKLSWED